MSAFQRAVSMGYRYLETDVHVTADGVLVAFHDATLDRVTDRSGRVEHLPWREVRRARIGGREPVALLSDVFEAWSDVRVNLDVKADAAVGPLIDALRRLGVLPRVCVGSFADDRLQRMRAALGPRLCTSAGPAEVRRLRLSSLALWPSTRTPPAADCLQIPTRYGPVPLVDPPMVRLAHRLGLQVHVWTVNDAATAHRLLDMGVDGLMTDDLACLRAVLVERGVWTGANDT